MRSRKWVSRRDALVAVTSLGGAAATSPLWAAAEGTSRRPTPNQTLGPFYPVIRPLDQDMDLTMVVGQSGRAEGQVIHLTGRVLNGKGEPVSGARIEVWQANAHGRYAHAGDANPAPLDPNFQGFATQLTDSEGRYRFKTIKPGAYPVNPANPVSIRTPHIHFDVAGTHTRLVTQMYFPGEKLNATDIVFNRLDREGQVATIGKSLAATSELEAGSVLIDWDIVLDKG